MADVPRVAGGGLRWLARALEHPWVGPPLAQRAHQASGLKALRELPAKDAPPAHKPWLEAAPEPQCPPHPAPPPPGPWAQAIELGGAGDAGAYVAAYREGRSTPTEVAQRLLAKAEDWRGRQPDLAHLAALDPAGLQAGAAASAARWAQGHPLGPLDGVPVLIKDELDCLGLPTGVGTGFLARRGPAAADATVVARLRAQGALILGKTTMHEVGLGTTGANATHGPARNPHDPTRYTGGSSSGSAGAVAGGLVPLAIGADGGGSIRIPASLCGVWGLKPTAGRVSEAGAFPLCWSVAHVGPIASSPEDLALGYAAIAGPDPADPTTLNQPPWGLEGLKLGLHGLRLGVDWAWVQEAQAPVVAAFRTWVSALEAAGAQVVELHLPWRRELATAHLITISSEMAAALLPHLEANPSAFGPEARAHLALGRRISSADYLHAQRLRPQLAAAWAQAMAACDLLLSPTTSCPAPLIQAEEVPLGSSDLDQLGLLMRYAQPANLLGFPALSAPMGMVGALPVGGQAMALPWREDLLLRFALAVKELAPRAQAQAWCGPSWA